MRNQKKPQLIQNKISNKCIFACLRPDFCTIYMDKISNIMNITREELQKFENNFRFLVEKYIQYFDQYNLLIFNSKRTSDEDLELKMIQEMLVSIGRILAVTIRTMGDDLFGKALNLYYHYKQIASTGDTDAQSLIKELKPLFANSLSNRIYMN